jgi:hypothetical protein
MSGHYLGDLVGIAVGLFTCVVGITSKRFYAYDSADDAKPLDIPLWIPRLFLLVIGFPFILLGMLDLAGIITVTWGGD